MVRFFCREFFVQRSVVMTTPVKEAVLVPCNPLARIMDLARQLRLDFIDPGIVTAASLTWGSTEEFTMLVRSVRVPPRMTLERAWTACVMKGYIPLTALEMLQSAIALGLDLQGRTVASAGSWRNTDNGIEVPCLSCLRGVRTFEMLPWKLLDRHSTQFLIRVCA